MTIGSTYNHPADLAATLNTSRQPWAARFPNPPDLCFDYRRLIEQPGGIARAAVPDLRICIIGAGVTGLTAARELLRCGFTRITLIEQSTRIGGRHLTLTTTPRHTPPATVFEMGAMRMPFFNRTGEDPKHGRSVMAYYADQFDLRISDFPNPGTPAVNATGIYLQDGTLTGDIPALLTWQNQDGQTPPPTPQLQAIHQKWQAFAARMVGRVATVYGSADWERQWSQMVEHYQHLSFRDLVRLPAIEAWHPASPGDFGGLGMSPEESALFYAIGIGDGSWGAFYDVCCLYPLRTAIFGFSSHLQLVHGRVNEEGEPLPAPLLDADTASDSRGQPFQAPGYQGLVALDECLMFLEIAELAQSLYSHLKAREDGLLTGTRVTGIRKQQDGTLRVSYLWKDGQPEQAEFDAVVLTVPSWLVETGIRLEGFSRTQLPPAIIRAFKTAHWETSCKVYAPLKKSFLRKNPGIPQILVTDSVVHDVYAYRYNEHYAYDCILLSYTWEDDATKLAAFSDAELVDKCVDELDRILLRCDNVRQSISPYVDKGNARVQRWITDRNALGCAKLYRAGTYADAVGLMKYNRDCSGASGLYLAGESFSVDAGWTEPCFRTALDVVINICNNSGAQFQDGFGMLYYPHYKLPS